MTSGRYEVKTYKQRFGTFRTLAEAASVYYWHASASMRERADRRSEQEAALASVDSSLWIRSTKHASGFEGIFMKTNNNGRTYYDVRTTRTRVGRFSTLAEAASAYRHFWEAQQMRAKAGEADGEGSSSMHVSRALHPDAYEQAADETLLAAAALCAVRDA